jgi:hypothetical protein
MGFPFTNRLLSRLQLLVVVAAAAVLLKREIYMTEKEKGKVSIFRK